VSDEQFGQAKAFLDFTIMTGSALDGQKMPIAFAPREERPKSFKFLQLHRWPTSLFPPRFLPRVDPRATIAHWQTGGTISFAAAPTAGWKS